MKVVVESRCTPVNGDKFTTLHGKKVVVTIVQDEYIPSVDGRCA